MTEEDERTEEEDGKWKIEQCSVGPETAIKSDISLFQLVKEYSTDKSDDPKEGTCPCQSCRCQRCQCQAAKRNCDPGVISLPIDS